MDQQPQPLTDRIAEALAAWAERGNSPAYAAIRRPETVTANARSRAAAVMAVVEPELAVLRAERDELAAELGARDDKARKRWIKNQEKQLGIRFADFRAGRWEMDLAMGREMAAAYVAMAKTMLGDAPNYTETKLEFDVKIAESPETYTLVVQRHAPGALTPHEARQRAEAERDRLLADIAVLIRELADRDDKLTQARTTGRRLNYRAQQAESQLARLTRTAPAARPAD